MKSHHLAGLSSFSSSSPRLGSAQISDDGQRAHSHVTPDFIESGGAGDGHLLLAMANLMILAAQLKPHCFCSCSSPPNRRLALFALNEQMSSPFWLLFWLAFIMLIKLELVLESE